MSLEDEIKKLTAAVVELTEAITGSDRTIISGSTKLPTIDELYEQEAKAPVAPKTPAKKPVAPKPATAGGTPASAPSASAPAPKKAETDAYAPVKKAILDAIANGHRKSITDMLAEYDAKTGQDLIPDVYDEVLEKIGVIVGGEVDLA